MHAAELIAADAGLGSMILVAMNHLQTGAVVICIISIDAIGFAIELSKRRLRAWACPWTGQG